MSGIEIFLIVVGMIAIAISFFDVKIFENKEEVNNFESKLNDEILEQKVSEAIDGIIDRKVESTEVKIEKILNEKIMTVGEYSENVISEIDKNHNEVMFLYGMLNDKEKEVKNTLIDIENIKKSIKKIEVEKDNATTENSESIKEEAIVNRAEVTNKQNVRNTEKQNLEKNKSGKSITNNKNNKTKNNSSSKSDKSNVSVKNDSKKNNNEKILELYKQGKEPMDIAKELKLGIGEVRLVIDLFKNRT